MKDCSCSEIDEMDIRLIKEALERDLRFRKHMDINGFYELYYPRLMAKLDQWQRSREEVVSNRLEVSE